jgi:ATP-dependent DNA helicase RecG
MTSKDLRKLILQGEGLTIEFKECSNKISSSAYETVCSFSNRYGGHLILGVSNTGVVMGVDPACLAEIKKDFVNTLNNPAKIAPTLYLSLEEIEIDGKKVLYAYIPVSSQVEICSGKIYDRVGESDLDITKSTAQVANLYGRKSLLFSEREIFPYATLEHLRLDLIPRVKQMALSKNPDHPWKNMDEMALFKSAGLYEEDLRTGQKGFNLAGILLFGKDEVIRSCAPGYLTDCLVRRKNLDRYDDRLTVGTNLIEAYDLIIGFIEKHTLDRFFLINAQNISVRSWIAREIVSNILVHREYSSAFLARVIINQEKIITENWNRSSLIGKIDPHNFNPNSKNPIMARFFVNIARADELGSGVRNLYYYTKIYTYGKEPELIEGDIFKTIVPIAISETDKDSSDSGNGSNFVHFGSNNGSNYGSNYGSNESEYGFEHSLSARNEDRKRSILKYVSENPKIKYSELSEKTGLGRRTVERYLQLLKQEGKLTRVGSRNSGYWEVKA